MPEELTRHRDSTSARAFLRMLGAQAYRVKTFRESQDNWPTWSRDFFRLLPSSGFPGLRVTRSCGHAKLMPAVGQHPQMPSPTPPSCSECASKTQPVGDSPPTQSASRIWRSSDGKTRIDTPQTSVISDPIQKHTIVLDHAKKEARVIPMTPPGTAPAAPGTTAGAAPPVSAPPVHVEDLGKSMIEGHEVEGKRYTLPTIPAPATPTTAGSKIPVAPNAPTAPGAGTPPAAPKLAPNVTEMWTSVKLKTPVLTKVSTAAATQTTYCKPTETAEHPASVFQIPAGYKVKPSP